MTTFARALILALPLALPAVLRAQEPERWSVLLLKGADTITKERVTGLPDLVTGDLVDKAGGNRLTWRMPRTVAGPSAFSLAVRGANVAPNLPPRQRVDVVFANDTAVGTVVIGDAAPVTRRAAAKAGATPYVNPSMALTEIAVRAAVRGGARTASAPLFLLNGSQVALAVTRVGDDSLVASLGGTEIRVKTDAEGRFLGGAIPSQGLTLVRGAWLDDVAMAVPKPDYGAPSGAPYTAEEVTVTTPQGHTLAGTLTKPVNRSGRLSVVVTSTGSGPQDRDEGIPQVGDYRPFRQLADTLGRRGIAVLRLDDRGTGGSTGDFASATTKDFANDVASAVAWLRARSDIDPARVFIAGHSEGGLVAPMVAAQDPQLAGIVLIAGPARTGRAILNFQLANNVRGDTSLSPARRDSALATVPRLVDSVLTSTPWMRFFADYDPLGTARRVRVPTLVLQGGTDQQVTPEQAELLGAALRAGGNRAVEVRVFPETNHLMLADPDGFPGRYASLPSKQVRAEVLGAVADWVVARAGALARPGVSKQAP